MTLNLQPGISLDIRHHGPVCAVFTDNLTIGNQIIHLLIFFRYYRSRDSLGNIST